MEKRPYARFFFFSNLHYKSGCLVCQAFKRIHSDVVSGWAGYVPGYGWALAHSEFGVSVNPIPTRGADYAYCITA